LLVHGDPVVEERFPGALVCFLDVGFTRGREAGPILLNEQVLTDLFDLVLLFLIEWLNFALEAVTLHSALIIFVFVLFLFLFRGIIGIVDLLHVVLGRRLSELVSSGPGLGSLRGGLADPASENVRSFAFLIASRVLYEKVHV